MADIALQAELAKPAKSPYDDVSLTAMADMLKDLGKAGVAQVGGLASDLASIPLAAYTSGFSMGNGQYPGAVMGETPYGVRDLGRKMGANVNSDAFRLGEIGLPDTADAVKVAKLLGDTPALNAMLAGMTAWHGSPHKFDKFKMSKIGTGEGAQAYGHGLYFAENKGVAGGYRKRLSNLDQDSAIEGVRALKPARTESTAARVVGAFGNQKYLGSDDLKRIGIEPEDVGFEDAADEIATDNLVRRNFGADDYIKGVDVDGQPADVYRFRDGSAIADIGGEYKAINLDEGHLYEVDIPDEAIGKMLDWDAPLSEQPESVQRAIKESEWYRQAKQIANDRPNDWYLDPDEKTGKSLYQYIQSGFDGESGRSPEAASNLLNELGIPGIRYLDGGSRGAGEGTRNMVLFDESLAAIRSRNGNKP